MNRPLPATVILSNNGRVPYDRTALRTYLETNNRWPHDRQQVSNTILTDLGVARHARTFTDVNWGQYNMVPVVSGNSSNNNINTIQLLLLFFDAVRRNDLARVALLLASGANVDAVDNEGWTPLHHAAYDGHHDTAALLLASGANVNAVNNDGWTPLHHAAFQGHRAIVELLLRSGANVSVRNREGRTARNSANRNTIRALFNRPR